MATVMCTKESGKMTKHTEEEFIPIMMDRATRESGLKMSSTVMEYKNGSMDHLTKGN